MPSATRWEWIQTVLSGDGPQGATVRLTLLGLARHMNRSGECWPSIERLQEVTHLGERTIRRDLLEAEDAGWIERTRRGRGYDYRALTPACGAGIEAASNGSEAVPDPDGHRQEVPVSATETPAGGAGIGGEEHRQEVPLSDGIPACGAGGHRQEVPVQRSKTGEEDAIPSLRSGQPVPAKRPVNSRSADPALQLLSTAATEPPGWKQGHPVNGGEVIGWWIELRDERPPEGEIKKQGAVAARLAKRHTRSEILRALVGMAGVFPHSNGEPWDLFDLERKFSRAFDGCSQHPAVKRWKWRRDVRAMMKGNGEGGEGGAA